MQMIEDLALVCYGNAVLKGMKPGNFVADNAAASFTKNIWFKVTDDDDPEGDLVDAADTPEEWLAHLKEQGVTGIRVIAQPQSDDPEFSDRMSVGMIGGGRMWILEVCYPDGHSEFWTRYNSEADADDPEQRIWNSTYVRIDAQETMPWESISYADLKEEMQSGISDMLQFAKDQKLDGFIPQFEDALAILKTGKVPDAAPGWADGYRVSKIWPKDFLPNDALVVLEAAHRSWVFGAMGSWNDMGFEGALGDEYTELSDWFFDIANDITMIAVTQGCMDAA